MTCTANLATFTVSYTSPAITTWVAFNDNTPVYGFILHVLNVARIHFIARIIIGSLISITFNVFVSVLYLCVLFAVTGIVVLHFWSRILLQKDFSFQKTVQIYNQLKILTKLVQEIVYDLVTPCLHHDYAVILSTVAMYDFILQFTKGNQVSAIVTLTALLGIPSTIGFERLAICFSAKASVASKEMLRILLMNHGKDKYRRRVVQSLLPNSISLEFLDSVDTIRNGVGTSYFLRYLDRVQSYTSTWLLATRHNQYFKDIIYLHSFTWGNI